MQVAQGLNAHSGWDTPLLQRHMKVLNEVLQVVSDIHRKPHNRRQPFPPTSVCQLGIYVHKTTCVDNDTPVLGIRVLKVAQSPVQSIIESTSQRLMNKLGHASDDRQPRQLTFEIGMRDLERVEPTLRCMGHMAWMAYRAGLGTSETQIQVHKFSFAKYKSYQHISETVACAFD
jgi:hypothetical protein